MRRILATLTVLVACLFGLPAVAHAAPAPLGGGSPLFTLGGARCNAAFAATAGSTGYLIAGANCPAGQLYSGADVLVGPVVAGEPTYSIVQVTNTAAWTLVPWIDTGPGTAPIAGSTPAPVGGSVCLVDVRVGTRCGTVTALNQTINFPTGPVSGLTRTSVCPEPGGGAVAFVSGDQAQGVPFGGSGNCSSGGVSYFMPVNRILSTYGLTLLTG
ncbi:MAG: S1 family peptidase [Actinophytocola sp.]|uniref:S1 family peptidase n=1 Tax=Actinophytocola sp. TaxID=1872138 RepID=UPI003D6BFABA